MGLEENAHLSAPPREFTYEFTVLLSDCDVFGHAGYAKYLRWQSSAIDTLFLTDPRAKAFLVKRARVKSYYIGMHYRHGTVYGDQVLTKLNTSQIEPTGCTLLFTFVLKGEGTVVGLGKQKIHFVDSQTGTLVRVPAEILEGLLKPIEVEEKSLPYRYE